jgi:hypothetical protein
MAQARELSNSPIENPDAPSAPRPAAPQYGPDGRLTYDSLRLLVGRGESVVLGGRHVSAANLPSELDYASAGGDQKAVDKAAADAQATIDRLTAELAAAKGKAAKDDDKPAKGDQAKK